MERPFREVSMENHKFYQNKACKFFPCHKGVDPDYFNCLFCYCPLYALGEKCGGGFSYTAGGIKDCSACRFPHDPENYEAVLLKMNAVLELAKRENNGTEKP